MRSPQDRFEVVKDGMRPMEKDTAGWLMMAILDEAGRCNQLQVGPQQMTVYGEKVFVMQDGQCCMSRYAVDPVRAVAWLERLGRRLEQLRVELATCVKLAGVVK